MPIKPIKPSTLQAQPVVPSECDPPPVVATPITVEGLLGVQRRVRLPVIRQSAVIEYERCCRAGLLSSQFGLRGYGRSAAMDKGSYAHLTLRCMCEAHLKGEQNGRQRAVELCTQLYDKLLSASNDNSAFPDWLDERRTDLNVGIAMGLYVWARELRPRLESGALTIVACELPLQCRLKVGNTPFRFKGQVDLICRDKQGGIWIVDLKTAAIGEDMATWADVAHRKIQPHLYTLALRKVGVERVNSDQIQGFLYLVLAKPGIKPHKAKGSKPAETLDEFVRRVQDWYEQEGVHADRKELASSDNPCCAVVPLYVGQQAQPWLEPRVRRAKSLMSMKPEKQWTLISEANCKGGYGLCRFSRICNESPSRYAEVVSKYFTQHSDPLDSDSGRYSE